MNRFDKQRERQLGNVQKELLSNYFLQKYSSLMSEMTHNSVQNYQQNFHTRPRPPTQKVNFKNLLQLKQSNKRSYQTKTDRNQGSNYSPKKTEQQNLLDSRQSMNYSPSSREQDKNNITMRKIEDSLVNQLFKESPAKLEYQKYTKIEIAPGLIQSAQIPPAEEDNFEVTYQPEEQNYQEDDLWDEEADQEAEDVRQAIKRQFQMRKEKPVYVKTQRNSSIQRRRDQSQIKSSKISVQGQAQTPKQIYKIASMHNSPEPSSRIEEEANVQRGNKISDSPQVRFFNELKGLQSPKSKPFPDDDILQKQIEFIAPSSSYYRSQNSNLVDQAFRFQSISNTRESNASERDTSGQRHQISHSIRKGQQKHSSRVKERKNSNSSGKESSRFQMSFVSKMSFISNEEGALIKAAIQKQLFQNELGPYQSALYSALQLIDRFPKSGPVFAVAQRTLEDRKAVEARKKNYVEQMQQYKRKIDRLNRRKQVWGAGTQDDVIRINKLKIMRLIRQLAAQHA